MAYKPDIASAKEFLEQKCGHYPANVLGVLEELIVKTEVFVQDVNLENKIALETATQNASGLVVGDTELLKAYNKLSRLLIFGK